MWCFSLSFTLNPTPASHTPPLRREGSWLQTAGTIESQLPTKELRLLSQLPNREPRLLSQLPTPLRGGVPGKGGGVYITSWNERGRMMLGTLRALANRGAICSSLKPAIPHPILVT